MNPEIPTGLIVVACWYAGVSLWLAITAIDLMTLKAHRYPSRLKLNRAERRLRQAGGVFATTLLVNLVFLMMGVQFT